MFCPKCGTKLPDGSKFCGVCGEKLINRAQVNNVAPVVSLPNGTVAVDTNTGAKKGGTKIIIFAIIAVVAIVAIAFGLLKLFSGSSKEDIFVALSKENYIDLTFDLITDVKYPETVEFDSCNRNDIDDEMVKFSSDGKYVYYFPSYYYEYLCRAEIDKIKKDPENCDEYIEVIAEEVKSYFALLDDNRVIYWTKDNELYLFDGNEKIKIADYAESWNYDDSYRLIYWNYNQDEGVSTIYGVDLNNPNKERTIATEVVSFENYYTDDFDNIIYTSEEGGIEFLYSVDFSGKKKVLYKGDKVLFMDYNLGTYIIGRNGEKDGFYKCKYGKLETVSDSVLSFDYIFGGIVYNTADGKKMIFSGDGGTIYELPRDVEKKIGDINDYQHNELFVLEDTVFLHNNDGTLMMASVKNGKVGEFKEIAEDVEYVSCLDRNIYFATDIYDENYNDYCDVYCVEKGKVKSLAENVEIDHIRIYENGTVAGYGEYEYPYGYELFLFDSKGNKTYIDDCVEFYLLVNDSTLFYVSENDLYIYKNGEKQKIKDEVYYVWSANFVENSLLTWFYGEYTD